MFLKQNYDLLVMFDMFNSISNIVLHCLCGKHFRNELRRMFQSCSQILKCILSEICCCYFQIKFQQSDQDQYVSYNATVTQNGSSNSSNSVHSSHLYLKIRTSSRPLRPHCCDCRVYFNRRPFIATRQRLSTISKEYLRQNQIPFSARYQSLIQRSQGLTPTPSNSMRLYFPQEQPRLSSETKTWSSCFR
jgi:hypothetical protein